MSHSVYFSGKFFSRKAIAILGNLKADLLVGTIIDLKKERTKLHWEYRIPSLSV